MKVSGFTFIRNAIKLDYPVVESIRSILPVCDEVVVAVGNSEDDTRELISNIDPKVRIIDTVWDDSLREGGRVLAFETDKAFRAISADSDWAFYIQGDEVLHENYLEPVYQSMQRYKEDRRVEGLLFDYLHFYGSYDWVGSSPRWYPAEIRVVKNDHSVYSFRDAQGFKIGNNRRLRVKHSGAVMFHYGWVRDPGAMQRKQESFHRHWHSDDWIEQHVVKASEYDYRNIDALERFTGTHPAVMAERLKRMSWKFEFDPSKSKLSAKDRLKKFLKKRFGIDLGYKNYKLI
ncbi:MAG: hypothetical protein Kow00127_13220 [Bacteroidales bacterium]